MVAGKRVGRVVDSWIISPLKSSDEHIFIQQANKRIMRGKRPWVAFETVKRAKPKNKTLDSFVALAPVTSKWRKTIGSITQFEIKSVNIVPTIENSSYHANDTCAISS